MQMYEKYKQSKILKLLCILFSFLLLFSIMETAIFAEKGSEYKNLKLIPGGMAFGVKFFTKGLLVVGTSEVISNKKEEYPAQNAGIKIKDIIVAVNDIEVNSIKEFSDIVESSEGKELRVKLTRNGQNIEVKLTAVKDSADGRYKAGVLLRDSTAGIGTITFINSDTGEFGGLGHGICDVDTGELIPLKRGVVMSVEIGGVVKGKSGRPGEIKGYFLPEKCGNVFGNTLCGVFGMFSKLPSQLKPAMNIGLRDEVQEGNAEIISTLGSDGPQTYTVEISKINRGGTDNKNFVIKVTDSKLIERTAGIIQGMSGSPIIQNGKLIGAVTHVMVNDPETGYGIFIENMLDAARSVEQYQKEAG